MKHLGAFLPMTTMIVENNIIVIPLEIIVKFLEAYNF